MPSCSSQRLTCRTKASKLSSKIYRIGGRCQRNSSADRNCFATTRHWRKHLQNDQHTVLFPQYDNESNLFPLPFGRRKGWPKCIVSSPHRVGAALDTTRRSRSGATADSLWRLDFDLASAGLGRQRHGAVREERLEYSTRADSRRRRPHHGGY